MDQYQERFRLYLKDLRNSEKLPVNELARRSKVSPSLISLVENGKRGIPKVETINSLAASLNIDITEMHLIAGLKLFPENLEKIKLSEIGKKYMTKKDWNEIELAKEMMNRKEREFQVTINNPKLKQWYLDLPNSKEEDLIKLKKMWYIIVNEDEEK